MCLQIIYHRSHNNRSIINRLVDNKSFINNKIHNRNIISRKRNNQTLLVHVQFYVVQTVAVHYPIDNQHHRRTKIRLPSQEFRGVSYGNLHPLNPDPRCRGVIILVKDPCPIRDQGFLTHHYHHNNNNRHPYVTHSMITRLSQKAHSAVQ